MTRSKPASLQAAMTSGQRGGNLGAGVAGGQRTHEDVRMLDGVHADAVTQQRAAGTLARRVDGDQADLDAIVLIEAEAADQFIGERRLAGTAGAGDTEYRCFQRSRGLEQRFLEGRRFTVFEQRDDASQQALVAGLQASQRLLDSRHAFIGQIEVGVLHDLVDHALQAHMHAVFRRVDAGHAVFVQLLDLGRHDHPAAATENLDVGAAVGLQEVDHVLEEFDVAALIRGDADALHVFLQRGIDDFLHRAVVAEVDDLGTGRLQDAAHDVDRRIVAVEQRGGGNETHLVFWLVRGQLLGNGKIGHGASLVGNDRKRPW